MSKFPSENPFPKPDWITEIVEDQIAKKEVRCYITQFHVRHLGFYNHWQTVWGMGAGQIAELAVKDARTHFDKKWPGTSKDMTCLGGTTYLGDGKIGPIIHMKDIPA